jgi:hypothetical protein
MISKRIEQYISVMNMFENIRWRFIASFGLGAFIALFLNAKSDDSQKAIIAGILAIIVSFAGIISQIRIFGLLMEIFARISALQKKEFKLLFEEKNCLSEVEKFLIFPRLDGKRKNIFTVHMATCLVFSSLIGTSIYLILCTNKTINLFALLSIVAGIGFLMWLSHWATKKYLEILQKERELKL